MRWLLPMAGVGLVAVAVPILVHLLSRDTAARYFFPSLRFLDRVVVQPARRTRLTDPWLLLVRCAILAGAVAALARPLWTTAARERTLASWTARAVIVDTSMSMAARRVGTERALDVARARADVLLDSASAAIRIETGQPREAIMGAARWLTWQGGRGELILVTDGQRGTLEAADVAAVPATIGIRIEVIAGVLDPAAALPDQPFPVRVLEMSDSVTGEAFPLLTRAQSELVRRIETDPLSRLPIQVVRVVGDTLDVLAMGDAYDLAATLLATQRSLQPPLAVFESDTARIPAAVMDTWERAAEEAVVARDIARDERSDARWVWALVLVLLAAEAVMRRRMAAAVEAP